MRSLNKQKLKLVTDDFVSEAPAPEKFNNLELALDMIKTIEALVSLSEEAGYKSLSNVFKTAHAEASNIAKAEHPINSLNSPLQEDLWDDIEWEVSYWKGGD